MSSSWPALHARFVRASERLSFQRSFRALAERHAALRSFSHPSALLNSLHGPGCPERKNQRLLALLREVQAPAPQGDVARTLLILALWPGLDATRGRLVRFYRGRVDLLDTEILGRLSIGLERAGNVRRVAATLLRNLERDIRRALMRDAEARTAQADHADETLHLSAGWIVEERSPSDFAARVCRALGRDGPLVVAVALDGLTQKEAARQLGLTHDVARKRYQRAMNELRARAGVRDR